MGCLRPVDCVSWYEHFRMGANGDVSTGYNDSLFEYIQARSIYYMLDDNKNDNDYEWNEWDRQSSVAALTLTLQSMLVTSNADVSYPGDPIHLRSDEDSLIKSGSVSKQIPVCNCNNICIYLNLFHAMPFGRCMPMSSGNLSHPTLAYFALNNSSRTTSDWTILPSDLVLTLSNVLEYLTVYSFTSMLLSHSCWSTCQNLDSFVSNFLLGDSNLADYLSTELAVMVFLRLTASIGTLKEVRCFSTEDRECLPLTNDFAQQQLDL